MINGWSWIYHSSIVQRVRQILQIIFTPEVAIQRPNVFGPVTVVRVSTL